MLTSFENKTKTVHEGKVYKSLSDFIRSRRIMGNNRSNKSKAPPEVVREFNSKYSKYFSPLLDSALAEAVGARVVQSSGGKGTIFDNIHVKNGVTTGRASETKSIDVTTDKYGNVLSAKPIHIATDEGINLLALTGIYTSVKKNVLLSGEGAITDKSTILKEEAINKKKFGSFIDQLVSLKNDQDGLKKLLSGKAGPARQLRQNFMLKSSDIKVPIVVGGVPKYKSIRWTWQQIVDSKEAKIKVTVEGPADNPTAVFFNIVFSQSIVTKKLQEANYQTIKFNKQFAEKLTVSIADSFSYLSDEGVQYLNTKLPKDAKIARTIINEHGSVLVYRGAFRADKAKKINAKPANVPKPQKFISSAQWTYLVQKRLGDSMLSFGEPEPPDIKERSGRFRRSVDVTANYRTKIIQYEYNPLYRSLEHYGYHPELQVERSIRQVAQDLYAREFSIVRRGSIA